ncbi:MAG: cytochrome c biogenesis protein ResB [Bacteroides sp.]|nr:cytochrome c biogenesis protein ResB [Bacteroides sp.]
MWQKPWGYAEGAAIAAGLFVTGTLLQITLGKLNLDLLSWPVNLILGGLFIGLILFMHVLSSGIYLFRWFSSYQAAVTSLASLVVMTVIMGFTRQLPFAAEVRGPASWLGFSQMLSSWVFGGFLLWFTLVLGLVILRRMKQFHLSAWKREIPFLFNHLGLFIALTAAVLGSADMQRMEMTTVVGKPEWRAFDKQRQLHELDFAIELHHFTIEEYPPKLMLIDNETGRALPEGKPHHLWIGEDFVSGPLGEWEVTVKQHLPMAASMSTEDTLRFVEFHSVGATYALYVEAEHLSDGERREGWVSCGNFLFPYKALRLSEQISLIMPEREPRRYASEVTVYTKSEKKTDAVVEVNKPLEIEGWKIYQLSYDESKGRWSDVSIFELVRDPWLPVVYTGIWMMIAGAVCLFVRAQTGKEEKV